MKIKKLDVIDRIDFLRAYFGFGLFAWWGFWCIEVGEPLFVNLSGFVFSLGGLR